MNNEWLNDKPKFKTAEEFLREAAEQLIGKYKADKDIEAFWSDYVELQDQMDLFNSQSQ